ncbi:GL21203 [Drosophila persimilis]|uniref:GL21203 n=1 Tax=Drosophila persimilis TaxID=7234 RepID=B4GWV4_DROPE|nr:GL21203 [Drosophila persimilis]
MPGSLLPFPISTNTKIVISLTAGMGVLGVLSHFMLRRRKYPCKAPRPVDIHELGVMGMHALGTAISCWEDAANVHFSSGRLAQRPEFYLEIQNLLEMAYSLQEQSRLLFCDEDSASDMDE